MLIQLPQVLTDVEVRHARSLLDAAPWESGRSSAGSQAASVKNNEQLAHDSDAARTLRPLMLQALDRQPRFFSATLPKRVFPPRFNRYGAGTNYYGNHVDNAVRYAPDSGQRIRTDLSCTLFLSDASEYDGGELVIDEVHSTRSIKLNAGDLVCYPGTSVHQVTPVTRGHRIACFFWIESLVRSHEQRRLLFEMDTALMDLRQAQGESAATVALTGTYHNLLRMWVDT
ncbi:MAG TPA: Fe2+-dependent dioxygenase [Burkholderiaceae bacterium]